MPIYKSTLNSNRTPQKPKKEKPPKKELSSVQKKKIVCASLLVFSLLGFLFSIINTPIKSFLLGIFGIFAYPMFLAISIFSIAGLSNKKYIVRKRYICCLSFSLFFVLLIVHLILTNNIDIGKYSSYLVQTYKAKYTGAGLILSLISFPMVKYLTVVGAYVFSIIGAIISIGFTLDCILVYRNTPEKEKTSSNFNFTDFKTLNADTNDVSITFEHKQEELKRKIAKQKLGIEKNETSIISTSMPIENISAKLDVNNRKMTKQEYILTPPEITIPDYSSFKKKPEQKPQSDDVIVNDADDFYDAKVIEGKKTFSQHTYENENLNNTKKEDIVENIGTSNLDNLESFNKDELLSNESEDDKFEENDFAQENEVEDMAEQHSIEYENTNEMQNQTITFPSSVESVEIRPKPVFETKNVVELSPKIEEKNNLGRPKKHYPPYVKPPVDLLNYIENVDVVTDEECNENIEKLEQVLEDFKIPAKVKAVQVGPAVTRYEIGMPTGISVKKVQMHADDIAMALASNGGIRIEAPIPGKNAVGIEVPNKNISAVSLREMIESLDYQKRVNPLSFVLGKDINGTIQFCNLDKMPHLLVAGSTGSGKSVCLNTMLISILYKSSPEDVRLILIDPKTVEFSIYANLPHLLVPNIITTKEQAINALNWAIKEMEYRYSLLQKNEVVNIKEYNNLPIVKDGEVDKLPYIVIVIDELNDLMIETKREMEERIMKLAQKSRAAGIHIVIATQRPSVDVITGTIKANLPSRIAFALTNFADSKTVLDMGGAEKLLGKGDMLFKPNDKPEPMRVQGAYVSSQEVSAVVKFIKANNPSDFDEGTTKEISAENEKESGNSVSGGQNSFDPVLKDALKWFISANQASITMIQRRFGVGYARAARIVDQMEQNHFISPQENSKPRQVLITMEEYNQLFPE